MTAPNLKLVDDLTDNEIAAIEADIKTAQKKTAISKIGGTDAAEILPPDGGGYVLNDIGNAERFLQIFGEDVLYVPESKKWLIWDKTHWAEDRHDIIFHYAVEFVKSLFDPGNLPSVKEAFSFANSSNNMGRIDRMLKAAQRFRAAPIEQFDTQPYLLNVKNGTLDLKTGELRDHSRADKITRIVNCDYDPDVKGNFYEKRFLERVQPDPSYRAFLQRAIGYSLLGEARERAFFLLYGTGNNGKSVFTNYWNNLLGQYAATASSTTVMSGSKGAIPNDIACLKGKRFIIISETEENERLNSSLIKALSAGDKVKARFLFGEYFDFYFSGKLWISTNHLPRVTDSSKGFWDRINVIPFDQNIPSTGVIKYDDLMSELMNDASAALNWAILGVRDYFDLDGLDVPEGIKKIIHEYKYDQDTLLQFYEHGCIDKERHEKEFPNIYVTEAEFTVDNKRLFAGYTKYCEEIAIPGPYRLNQIVLGRKLKERGFIQKNNGKGRVWQGFRLRSEFDS